MTGNSFDGFAEDAARESNPQYTRGCGLGQVLKSLSPGDREKVQAVLDRPEITAKAIRDALATRLSGFESPSTYTVRRHRSRNCGCQQ